MAFPTPGHVGQCKWLAYLIVSVALVIILGHASWQVFRVFSQADAPPTVVSVVDGRHLDDDDKPKWGRLPDLIIQSPIVGVMNTINPLNFDPYVKLGDNVIMPAGMAVKDTKNLVWLGNLPLPLGGFGMRINTSAFYPDFAKAAARGELVKIPLTIESNSDDWRWFKFLTVDPQDGSKYTERAKSHILSGMSTMVSMTLTKTIIPKTPGIHWGWPFDSTSSTTEDIQIVEAYRSEVPEGQAGAYPTNRVFFHIIIESPVVIRVAPKSILDQLAEIGSTVGGGFSLLTVVFGLIFVKAFRNYNFETTMYELHPRWVKQSRPPPVDMENYQHFESEDDADDEED